MTKRKSIKVENISMIIACALFALMFKGFGEQHRAFVQCAGNSRQNANIS